jgi:hypothetical protein
VRLFGVRRHDAALQGGKTACKSVEEEQNRKNAHSGRVPETKSEIPIYRLVEQ